MSLTFGSGPLSTTHGSTNLTVPRRAIFAEPWGRRLRAVLGGETVFDTEGAMTVHETGKLPVQWIPLSDIQEALLRPTGSGNPSSWDVVVGDRVATRAVRAFHRRDDADPDLDGFVTITFDAMDRWFDEDDPVYAHLKDPYHRVDVRSSSRQVAVRQNGQVVAESDRPALLFETGLPTRYYLPFADVRLEHLSLSETVSECPYKGDGQHWHLTVGGETTEDAAWSLPHPLPEGFAAAEHICFYPAKVEVEVDGKRVTQ
jgi:uncharacterized protein (DUF427 family)